MDFLLLTTVIACFIINSLLMRYFFKRLSDKITFITDHESPAETAPTKNFLSDLALGKRNYGNADSKLFDPPSANQASIEESNDLELNEQNLTGLPLDVKFAVEGGDVHIPPGFEEQK